MDVILIKCVVKGYHECGFTVKAGEIFFLEKKIGSCGDTFCAVCCKGQLRHIQKELLEVLLHVILEAHAVFISVTVLLVTLSVTQAKKFTINFIDIQVVL